MQNRHSKWVTGKIVFLKGLGALMVKAPVVAGAFFMSSSIVADWGKLLCNYIGLYLVCFHGVRWFGGLTSFLLGFLQFAARTGNGKSKSKGK